MNETYKLPFTAKEIEEKLEKAGEKGLEFIGSFDGTCLGETRFIHALKQARVVIAELSDSEYERKMITWEIQDNYTWDQGSCDLSIGTGTYYVSPALNVLLSAGGSILLYR